MAEQVHVLATFESQEALLAAMTGAVSWVQLSEAETIQLLKPAPPDPYADKALRPGLTREKSDG
jgi:hypothetical protein